MTAAIRGGDPYQTQRALSDDERDALRAAIESEGLLVPIVLDQHGDVIDGHHRRDICAELDIEARYEIIPVRDAEHARMLSRMLNNARRAVTPEERYAQVVTLAAETDGDGVGIVNQRLIAAQCGLARSRVSEILSAYKENPQDRRFVGIDKPVILPDRRLDATGVPRSATNVRPIIAKDEGERDRILDKLPGIERIGTGKPLDARAVDVLYRADRARRRREGHVPYYLTEGDIETRVGDLRDAFSDIDDGSIDAVVTDPPYPREYVELYGALGKLGARVLRPNGILAALSGQIYLGDIMRLLDEHMDYRWLCSYTGLNRSAGVIGRMVLNVQFKPILVYHPRGAEYSHEGVISITGDEIRSGPYDGGSMRADHHWGQTLEGITGMVERFTRPGDLVMDPFMGGGTTAIACRLTGRRFIGCDIDAASVALTRERLSAMDDAEDAEFESVGVD